MPCHHKGNLFTTKSAMYHSLNLKKQKVTPQKNSNNACFPHCCTGKKYEIFLILAETCRTLLTFRNIIATICMVFKKKIYYNVLFIINLTQNLCFQMNTCLS